MNDQGMLNYGALKNVPVMVSQQYTLPDKMRLKLQPTHDVSTMRHYNFTLERNTFGYIERMRQEQKDLDTAREARWQAYEEEKLKAQKLAARKIAPGFLDTNIRILKPEPVQGTRKTTDDKEAGSEDGSEGTSSKSPSTTIAAIKSGADTDHASDHATVPIDYRYFEPGFAPPDPWDAPVNDLAALRSILDHTIPNASDLPSVSSALPPYTQPSHPVLGRHGDQGTIYWPLKPNTNASQSPFTPPRHVSTPPPAPVPVTSHAPALPPKVFHSASASPALSHPSIPGQSNSPPVPALTSPRASSSVPPPLPPPPPSFSTGPNEHLVQELIHMGFSRSQAETALEKNDGDLVKATNFLLDQGE